MMSAEPEDGTLRKAPLNATVGLLAACWLDLEKTCWFLEKKVWGLEYEDWKDSRRLATRRRYLVMMGLEENSSCD